MNNMISVMSVILLITQFKQVLHTDIYENQRPRDSMNEERYGLISIGELSKLTGVGIKSLRYYDEIGVLVPAYVDPDSKYRYYAFNQVSMVVAIQFYVDMGIPLERLKRFTDENGVMDFAGHIDYAVEEAQEHIEEMQLKLKNARILQKEIKRAESLLNASDPIVEKLPAMNLWASAVSEDISEAEYNANVKKLLLDAHKAGSTAECISGLLTMCDGDSSQSFCFISLPEVAPDLKNDQRFMHLKSGSFSCIAADYVPPASYSQKILNNSNVIIFMELFTGKYIPGNKKYELRWN